MKRLLWLLPLAGLLGAAWMIYSRQSQPPAIPFAKAQRERLVSTLITNGKVEPLEWSGIRAEREGLLKTLRIEKGQTLRRGDAIGEIDTAEARADLAAAESRIAQANAELDTLRAGGRTRELADLATSLDRQKLELAAAQREVESLRRLVDKKAATGYDLDQARTRAERIEAEIAALDKRRQSLVSRPDLDSAQARLKEAETSAGAARERIANGVIRSPGAGTVYQLEARAGVYLRPGDSIGQVGVLDRVRVRVYVDEPELGAVKIGQPVTVTWDAMAGQRWEGTVEKLPTEIVPLGTRQVGEVICNLDNPGRTLIPGTNVTAEIRLQVVENALTVPKEVLRRENTESGVYVLVDGKVVWRKVKLGAASVTRIQVLEGVREGDLVALPTEEPLRDGLPVRNATP